MAVETPAGDLITPANAAALGVNFTVGSNMSYYRLRCLWRSAAEAERVPELGTRCSR